MDALLAAGGPADDRLRSAPVGRTRTRRLTSRLAVGTLALAACARPGPAPAVHARKDTPGIHGESAGPDARPATTSHGPPVGTPEIRYELTHDPAAACWRVRLRATGIDPAGGDLRLVLEDWGEWTRMDATYLREFHVRPPARPDPQSPGSIPVEPPPDWDGTLEASYVLPLARFGSSAQQEHSLLPKHDESDAAGFSINTFFD
ncbi:MAG: hypothetical protein ACREIU_05840, partial [Planctomycetota bacterium]